MTDNNSSIPSQKKNKKHTKRKSNTEPLINSKDVEELEKDKGIDCLVNEEEYLIDKPLEFNHKKM